MSRAIFIERKLACVAAALASAAIAAMAQPLASADCSSSSRWTRFSGNSQANGLAFEYPDNWGVDQTLALIGPPGRIKQRGSNAPPWIVCGVTVGIQELGTTSPGAALRRAHAEFLKSNAHLQQTGEPEVRLRSGLAIVVTRFNHRPDASGDEREQTAWASVFPLQGPLDPDYFVPSSRPSPARMYNFVLTGPDRDYPDLERQFDRLLASVVVPSSSAAVETTPRSAQQPESTPGLRQPLVGVWTGLRPTNGYVWEFRFTLELKADGTYSYALVQTGNRGRPWKLSMTGRWGVTRSNAAQWPMVLELTPDPNSPGPPTEEDRVALFDDLGLPDNRPHRFRVRPSSVGGFTVQPIEANPSDSITQTWSLRPQ